MKRNCVLPALALAALLIASPALAHGGGTDKFGGHTEKATGQYHCHGEGEKRALCDLKVDRDAFQAAAAEAAEAARQARVHLTEQREEINRLQDEKNGLIRLIEAAERNRARLETEKTAAGRHARNLAMELARAVRDRKEAEARAAGKGPAVSSRCKDAIAVALDKGRLSWGSTAKDALRRGCL